MLKFGIQLPIRCGTQFSSFRSMSFTPTADKSLSHDSRTSIADQIIVDESPTKAVITLNRPKILNAMNYEMIVMLFEQLKRIERSKMLVVVKGAGEKSFSVGGDVAALVSSGLERSKKLFRTVYRMDYFISQYKIPYVALMDGMTMGGGLGICVHGRYRIATERTVIAMPENAIGLFPDVGSSYFLSKLSGKLGLYLGMTGHRLKAEDVEKVGIATHFCESDKLARLESALLECSDVNDVPGIINRLTSKNEKEFSLSPHLESINKCFAGRTVEEIFMNLEKDGSKWAENTLETLKQLSPLSLKITHRQFQLGSRLTLAECLKMEYRIVERCMESSDFQEGVRALIIDKDKKPRWNPPTLDEVTAERVDEFFPSMPDKDELKLDV